MSRYGKNLPTQRRGKPIRAADLNAVRAVAEGLSRQQLGGSRSQTTIAGVPVSLAGNAGVAVSKAKVAAGGITAMPDADTMGQGNVTLYSRDGADVTAGATVSAYSFVSLAAGTWCYVALVDGGWEVISATC